jgi:hypothetical protein
MSSWACSACTFNNDASNGSCTMCESPRPGAAPGMCAICNIFKATPPHVTCCRGCALAEGCNCGAGPLPLPTASREVRAMAPIVVVDVQNHMGMQKDGRKVAMELECACGNILKDDSVFCRKCGERRPIAMGGTPTSQTPPSQPRSPSIEQRLCETKELQRQKVEAVRRR